MTRLARLTRDGIAPETSRPDPAKVTRGDPVHMLWPLEDDGSLFCGLWQSTPGAWRVSYSEWEYCHILSGHSVLTEDGRESVILRAGDSIVIRPGFTGIWDVVETTLKDYVIRL